MTKHSITPKQQEILFHLYTFRYLNRHHIQHLLNHKDSARINKWLTDLTNKHYIHQIYSNTYGENTKPAIYYLGNNSITILKNNPNVTPERLVKVYKERGRTNRFISHCQLVADVYISFDTEAKATGKTLYFYAKTELLDHEYLLKPVPDAYIALEHKKTTKRYFLDIFDDNTPRFAIRKRINDFSNYAESGEWEEATDHPFPNILFVFTTDQLKNYCKRLIAKELEEREPDFSFYLATQEALKQSTWEKVWQKAT